jgi:hypothetical protein
MRQYLTIGFPEATLMASSVVDPQKVLSEIIMDPFSSSTEDGGEPGNYSDESTNCKKPISR